MTTKRFFHMKYSATILVSLLAAACGSPAGDPSIGQTSAADTTPPAPAGFGTFVESCVPAGYHNSGTNEAWHDGTTDAQNTQAVVYLRDQWAGKAPSQCGAIGSCDATFSQVAAAAFRFDAASKRLFVTCKGSPGEMAIYFLPAP